MPDRITAARFHQAPGVDDWRVVAARGACACFRVASFAEGVELVSAIGRLAAAEGRAPEIELRGPTVTVRLTTHGGDGMTEDDIALAREISAVAGRHGAAGEPSAVQDVNLTITTADPDAVRPFWRAVLRYDERGEEDLVDALGQGPSVWFQRAQFPGAVGNRVHVDVFVAHDQARARVAAAVAAGGRLVSDRFAPAWWTLADADGNQVDIATWRGRDDEATAVEQAG